MKFKMAEHSVFAILLRKPWWVSGLIAVAVTVISVLALPPVVKPAGFFAAIPFFAIAGMSAWKRRHLPSAAKVEAVTATVSAMPWSTFAQALQAGFERDGSTVKRLDGARADFELTRAGHTAVVSARRWKAARTGVEPLRALLAETRSRGANESIYVSVNEISDTARAFARDNRISVIAAAEIARLMPELK